jgi:putative transposase
LWHDRKLLRSTIESMVVERPKASAEQPQGMCLNKGYDYDEVRAILCEFGFTAHIRARGEEAKELAREAGKRARRWGVERSHSWMNRFRRILVRWEKKPEHYIAFLHFACALIAFGEESHSRSLTSVRCDLILPIRARSTPWSSTASAPA